MNNEAIHPEPKTLAEVSIATKGWFEAVLYLGAE